MKKIGIISLGCEKNRIDAEMMLGILEQSGYEICDDMSVCDVIIVNTCTFIDAAKTESIDSIFEAAKYKTQGCLKRLIVTSCMAERYKQQIMELIPEVDACLGSKCFDKICDAIEADSKYEYYGTLEKKLPEGKRILTHPGYSVYVKIAEGCSNHCTYCVIPSVRGEFMPRDYDDVIEEIRTLAFNGAKEINLIAQDTTKYPQLCKLIRETCAIASVKWVRVLYCRPEEISEELLDLMASEPKFVKYIDIPLQHASGRILKLMNRTGDDKSLYELMQHIRNKVNGVSLRTTFITGFPKETDSDFEIMCEFIKKVGFDNLGVFTYSREEGTPAGRMHGQIPQEIKQQRADIIMTQQYTQLEQINKKHLGKVYDVLCEGVDEEQNYIGRAYFQAPDIDGRIYFKSEREICEGDFIKVYIDKYSGYDLYGKEIVE